MAPKPTTKCSSSKLFEIVQQWLWQSGPKHSDFHRPRATVQIRTDIDKFERHNYFLPLRQPTLIVCIISVFHSHKTYVAHQVICLAFREHATPTIFFLTNVIDDVERLCRRLSPFDADAANWFLSRKQLEHERTTFLTLTNKSIPLLIIIVRFE